MTNALIEELSNDSGDLFIRAGSDNAGPCTEIRNRKTRHWHSLYKDHAEAERFLRCAQAYDVMLNALEIIAGEQQCVDNLMSHSDVARAALIKARSL